MRRRLRLKRRRLAGLILLPVTLILISGASAAAPMRQAAIDSGKTTVRYGEKVGLHGSFPGVKRAKVEVLYRAAGNRTSRVTHNSKTGAHGFFATRIKPNKSGYWRARLASPRQGLDNRTGKQRVKVRSRTAARVERHALLGRSVKIRGRVRPGDAHRRVSVKTKGAKRTTRTNAHGRFSLRLPANSLGTHRVRVNTRGTSLATGSHDRAGSFTVYRRAGASWYGPGLYGHRTACGQTLTSSILGVAHKTLPCGTKVKLRYGSRSVTATVIDRGPYVAGRDYDLTYATKQRLHFPGVATVLSSR